jgi:8-oxo-dGTP diphosphatase
VREVREETGVTGRPGVRLPTTSYSVWSDSRLVPKLVDYWAMTVKNIETFAPSDEVDEIAWLPVPQALDRLTYDHDQRVLRTFGAMPAVAPAVVLLRHAWAGDRHAWTGPDAARPLDADGQRQAASLAALLPLFDPRKLVSAQPLRCRQTLAPTAARLGLDVSVDARFSEDAQPRVAAEALRELAAAGEVSVVCSQGGLIPPAVALLSGRPESDHLVIQGDAIVLTFAADTLVAADPLTTQAP